MSLTCVDAWTRRGCPVTIAADGKKSFDLDAVEIWRWFQDKKNNDEYFRDLCAQPIAEVIEAVQKAQGRLSFWLKANAWSHPNSMEQGKALLAIDEACETMSDLTGDL